MALRSGPGTTKLSPSNIQLSLKSSIRELFLFCIDGRQFPSYTLWISGVLLHLFTAVCLLNQRSIQCNELHRGNDIDKEVGIR